MKIDSGPRPKHFRNPLVFRGIAALLLLSSAMVVNGQQAPEAPPFFQLSAVSMGDIELPPLFILKITANSEGALVQSFEPLPVASNARGEIVEVSLVPGVKIHTGSFDAGGNPQMKPFLDIPAKGADDRLLLVFYHDKNGGVQRTFLDDSSRAHPAGTVRMVNFSENRVAFTVGQTPIIVPPGEDRFTKPLLNDDVRFSFKHFVETPDQVPFKSGEKLLRFRKPDARLLVLYTALPEFAPREKPEDPRKVTGYVPIAYRLYDTVKDK